MSLLEAYRKEREDIDADLQTIFCRWEGQRGKQFSEFLEEEMAGARRAYGRYYSPPRSFCEVVAGINIPPDPPDEFLKSRYFSEIPFVRIETSLWATVADELANMGRKKKPDHGFSNDVRMLSLFLPACDAMFIDKECYGLLNKKDIHKIVAEYDTKVFSLRSNNSFLEYLEGIEKSMTPEHANLLNEVYGEERLRPYMELYNVRRYRSAE